MINGAQPVMPGFASAGINAAAWGAVGGILRGLWFLKDKVGDRRYRKAWWIYFISVPFLGAIFGALVYFIIVGGLLAFDPNALEASSVDLGTVTEINTTRQVTETSFMDQQDLPGNSGNSSGQQQLLSINDDQSNASTMAPAGNQQTGDESQADDLEQDLPGNSGNSSGQQQFNDDQTTGVANTTQVTTSNASTTAPEGNQQTGDESQADDLKQGTLRRSLAIIALAALAGFNWEWIVSLFKRIGELVAPNDKGSFQGLLEDDITKLDR
jgi:hypothetical protein